MIEISDVEHNKSFINRALKSASNELLVSILRESLTSRKSLDDIIRLVAAAPKQSMINGLAFAKNTEPTVPVAGKTNKHLKQDVEGLAKDSDPTTTFSLRLGSNSHSFRSLEKPQRQKSQK